MRARGLRALVSAALLAWLLSRVDLAGIGRALSTVHWGLFTAAACLHLTGVALTAWRWGILLRAQGLVVPWWYLARSFLIASFFNYFLPTSVGGDVYRALDTARYTGQPEKALGVLVVERASGLVALILLAVGATPWAAQRFESPALVAGPLVLTALFAAAAVLVCGERSARWAGLVTRLPVLCRARHKLATVRETMVAYRHLPRPFLGAFGVGFLLQLNFVLHHFLISQALGLGVPLSTYLFLVPLVSVLLLLPASINGVGIRENAFVILLGRLGVPREGAAAFCTLILAAMLVFGVAGGLAYALRGREGR